MHIEHPTPSTGHVVLLGDSILDNKAYVDGGPDVVAQLRQELPPGWRATLLAVDGDVASGVARQLRSLPADATHLVVSVGGNDALGYAYLLQQPATSVAQALEMLRQAQLRFAAAYAAMAEAVALRNLPTAICTIYDTPASEPGQPIIRTALAIFNDCITRTACSRELTLIDLRLICDEDGDYANPIEPSVQGGRKISQAISAFLFPDRTAHRTAVIGSQRPNV
jgi:lysophospholipase L1-like esterase